MMDSNSIHRIIQKKFHVHPKKDVNPYMGFEGTRGTLADLFADLGYKAGAEIGVQGGRFSKRLCKNNPELTLYCIDTWAPFTTHNQEWQDNKYDMYLKRTAGFNCVAIKKSSIVASKDFENESLDFVYIDALHDFDNCMMDILHWAPKVRYGGIISGHDYEHYYSCGVVRAVDAWSGAHGVNPYYITPKDPPRSWFLVKNESIYCYSCS